ncbi:hypothetical protein [Streptomyces sp. NPDC048643]|uniref:hypothetical protein n=1 Tax=Streptomyces sp. NPDC048643 TaxID=3155637 RepID=UPI003432C480
MFDFLKLFVVAFVLSVLGLCASAFGLMIYVGVWHGYNAAVPAVGFIDCLYAVGILSLLGILGGSVKCK